MLALLKNIVNFVSLVNDRTVNRGISNTFRKEVQIKPLLILLVRSTVLNRGLLFGLNHTNHTYNNSCLDQVNSPMQEYTIGEGEKPFCRGLFLFSSFKIVFVVSYFSSVFF